MRAQLEVMVRGARAHALYVSAHPRTIVHTRGTQMSMAGALLDALWVFSIRSCHYCHGRVEDDSAAGELVHATERAALSWLSHGIHSRTSAVAALRRNVHMAPRGGAATRRRRIYVAKDENARLCYALTPNTSSNFAQSESG